MGELVKVDLKVGEGYEGIEELLKRSVVKDNPFYPVVRNPWDSTSPGLRCSANRFIGIQLHRLGAYDIALEYFEKALVHDSLNRPTLINLAETLIALGKFERAYKVLTQVQVLCEKRLEKFKGFKTVELVDFVEKDNGLDLGDYEKELVFIDDEMLSSIDKMLEGNLMAIYELKGFILSWMEEHELAIEYYNKSLSLENTYADKDSDTLFNRGVSLYESGKTPWNSGRQAEAVLDFQQALKQDEETLLECDQIADELGKTIDRMLVAVGGVPMEGRSAEEDERMTREFVEQEKVRVKKEALLYESTRTGKEHHLLTLVISGKSDREIAEIFGVSEEAIVDRLLNVVFEKTDC